jgi:prepilin-type N-terminal cleavage/methylation domain-containing protein
MHTRTRARRRDTESGVTLIELLIAITILSIGLVALAQLFVVAALNNTFAVTTSGAVNNAQRLIESWKVKAAVSPTGVDIDDITSGTYDEGTEQSTAFAQLDGYYAQESRFRESVWVFDRNGDIVGDADPELPPGITDGELRSAGEQSRLVYILMEPKVDDPKTIQTVVLTALVTGEDTSDD